MQNGFWKLAVMAGVIAVCLVVVVQVNRQLSGDGALQAGSPAVEGDKVDLPFMSSESETDSTAESSSVTAEAPTLLDPAIDEFGDAPPEIPTVSAPEPLPSLEKGPSLASAPSLKPQAEPVDDFWGAQPRPVASGPGLDFRAVQAEPSEPANRDAAEQPDSANQSEPAVAVIPTSLETSDPFDAGSDPSKATPALVPVAEAEIPETDDPKTASKLAVREVSASADELDLPGQLPTEKTSPRDLVETPEAPTPALTPVPEEAAQVEQTSPASQTLPAAPKTGPKFDDLVAAVPPSLRTRQPSKLPTLTSPASADSAKESGEKSVSTPGRATLKNEASEAAGVVLVAGLSDSDDAQEEVEVDPFADFAPSPAPAQVPPKPASSEADPFADPPALPELPSENPRPTANDVPPADPFDFAAPPAMDGPSADPVAAPLEGSDKPAEEKPVPAPTDDPFDFGVEISPKPARSSRNDKPAEDFRKNDPASAEPDPFSAEPGPEDVQPGAEPAPHLPTMLGDEPVSQEPVEDPAPSRQRRPLTASDTANDFPALPQDLDAAPAQPEADPFGALPEDGNATTPRRSSPRNRNLADEADPFPALDLPEPTEPRPAPSQPTEESGLVDPPTISLGEPAPLREPALPEPALPDPVLPQETPPAREKPVRPMVVDFPKSSRSGPAPIQQIDNQQFGNEGHEESGPREMSLEERTDQPRRLELFPEETPRPEKPVLSEIDFLGDGVVPETAVRGLLEPRLAIEKIAPTSAQLGQPLVYSVVVKNVGGSAAKQVTVEDRIPKGTRLTGTAPRAELIDKKLRWKLGDLAPGEERKISIRVIPESEGSIGSVATVNFVAEVAAEIMVTSPQLKLELEAPAQARINEPVNYKFRVTNTGNGDASQVLVRNILPETLQHPAGRDLEYSVGLLKAGESREVTLQLVPVKTGRIANTATVTGDGGLDEQATVEVEVVGEALVLTRTAHDRVYVGRPAKITNTVANESPLSVEKIQISEMVPVGFEVVEASNAGQFDPATRTIVWSIGPVPAGHQQAVTATLVPKALGAHKGSVTAMGVSGSLATLNTAVDVIGIPALSVESPGDARIVAAGERVTIRLQVKNRGTGPANNLELKVDLPDSLELIDAKGPTSGGLEGTKLSFQPLKQLPAQGIALYELVLKTSKSGENRLDVEFIADHLSRAVHREELLQVIEQMQ